MARAIRRAGAALAALPGRGLRAWSLLRPAQQLVLGFASYVLIGTGALCLPWSQAAEGRWIDHLFNATSAMSTTGLTTTSVADSYSRFGQFVLVCLFQLGGIGYMTLSSVLLVARGRTLSDARMGVLRAGFAVPHYFDMRRFIVHVMMFTTVVEVAGFLVLWSRFAALGAPDAAWSAAFHTVSAFATAGFSLHNTSLEAFRGDWVVNLTIGGLCYLGAIGFIVVQDAWYSIRFREHMLTFTSKVILVMTAIVFAGGTAIFFWAEPSVRSLPLADRVLASAFQVMTASSTAGFNTIPIGALAPASLVLIMIAMVIGASPAGTGGGMKTTTVSALWATTISVMRSRSAVLMLGHEIPMVRVVAAAAAATFYLVVLAFGIGVLCLTERAGFLPLVFEASSALGTVGLSMGITADLSDAGKLIVTALMFAGRCGPLTIGLALLRPKRDCNGSRPDDLAV